MAQFDVHRNPGTTRTGYPLLLVLQSSLFQSGNRWVVIPLAPAGQLAASDPKLNPVFDIHNSRYILLPQAITNVPRASLGAVVANLKNEGEAILSAMDWLMNRGWD